MTDPIELLEKYGRQADMAVSPITEQEIRDRMTPLAIERGPSRVPAWAAAAAVAALLLIVLGGVSLLAGGAEVSVVPASPVAEPLGVEVVGVSGFEGYQLAGVLYEGDELNNLDRDAIGGFWTIVTTDDYTTTEIVREPNTDISGPFPHVTTEALTIEPGTYTLVLWVDTSIGGATRWVPINTDGMGLYGCHHTFELTQDTATTTITPTLHPNGWNTNCTTGATIPNTDPNAAVNPFTNGDLEPWPEWTDERQTSMPPATGLTDGPTLGVEVVGVSGFEGYQLAGVLYEGDELNNLDRDAIGGFWTIVTTDDYTTTEIVREPNTDISGPFPHVITEALTIEPGTYTLVLWVDTSIGGATRWVPINTDGMGLYGCHHTFELTQDTATTTITPTLHPNGWNTNCTTGATIPNTDPNAAVNPNPDGSADR